MRSGLETLGAVNLFRSADRPLLDDQVRLAQAFADVATAGLLQRRETEAARRLAAQLQTALDSRRLIEQAKGVLAERYGIGPEAAFRHLRRQARDGNRKIHELASAVVEEANRSR
jgi:AmiR/NasT family two-component response regulator